MTPLLNKTTALQDQAAYRLFRQLVLGQDVEVCHILKSLKLNAEEEKGKAWRNIPALAEEFGLWQHNVKQIYNGFIGRSGTGARTAIIILAITDETLCGLIRRYSSPQEI